MDRTKKGRRWWQKEEKAGGSHMASLKIKIDSILAGLFDCLIVSEEILF
jgi:hypothetical protein